MGRHYKCKACGEQHAPPTGKQCNRGAQDDSQDRVMPLLLSIQAKVADIEQRVNNPDSPRSATSTASEERTPEQAISPLSPPVMETVEVPHDDIENASPETLRRDRALMQQASRRLARLRLEDWEDEDDTRLQGIRLAGKKSGAVMTAADVVMKRIDWPHFYIKRVSNNTRKGITFKELKVEEFVFGFLCMIEAPHANYDFRYMIRVLRNIMQDTIDFSWENARGFYQMVGADVGQGAMKWSDSEVVKEMRMTYARTVFPPNSDSKEAKETTRPALQSAPAGMKCCVAYQKKECDNPRDHQPFTHACAYCHRVKAAICRHPENDCYRKTNDLAKNARPRE